MKKLNIKILIPLLIVCCSTVHAQTVVNFKDPDIYYMGRVGINGDAAELTWPASSVIINFNGTSAKATLKDNSGFDFITVVVDDQVVSTIQPTTDKKEYDLVSGLSAGPHKLELFKRTEYDMGKLIFYQFDIAGKVLPPPVYKHRMEFYGNSITCGYAIEDKEGKDRGTYEFVNAYKSYANLTARHFNAHYNSISKSGIGITISWFNYVMPDIYNRLAADDGNVLWDFSRYSPEVVVVNLFQNDAWLVKNFEHEQFKAHFGTTPPTPEFIIKSYQDFISKIRGQYPNAKIICALGSMDATQNGSPWPGYIKKAVAGLKDKSIYVHFFPYKNTPGHPSEKQQQDMAGDLITFMEKNLKW